MSDLRSAWERFKQAENPEFGRLSEDRAGSLRERMDEHKQFSAVPLLEKEPREQSKPQPNVRRKQPG